MALDELCLNCSKKTLKGLESVMNRLEGKHGTKASLGGNHTISSKRGR